jgi:hypothetical protein
MFFAIVIGGSRGILIWLEHHSSLSTGWRFLIAILAATSLGIGCSLALDQIRRVSRS